MKKAFLILLAALVGLFACAIPAAAEEASTHPDPIAYYTFDDAENLGADSSGNGNDLQIKGTPTYNDTGAFGGSMYLDGASALVAEEDEAGMDYLDKLQDTTGQFTLTYWFKVTRADLTNYNPMTDWRRVVSNGMIFNRQGGFTMINNPDNKDNPSMFNCNPFVEYDNGHYAGMEFPAYTSFTESWVFVALTVDAKKDTLQYYVNGALTATITPDLADTFGESGPIPVATGLNFAQAYCPLTVGAYYYNDGSDHIQNPYTGALDQMGIFDTILTEDDILYYMRDRQEAPEGEEPVIIGQFYEGDNVVFRYDSVRDITKSISSHNYVEVGMLDKSAKLKFWGDMPLIQKKLDAADAFSLEDYPYMKIKYCCRTENPKTIFMFATSVQADYVSNDTLTFEHQNEVWEEKTFDMSTLKGWNGRMASYQLLPTPLCDDQTEAFFLEYIAFFKTKEAADAFGGITQAQKNGTDPVSLYFSRGYVNPYLGYPVREQAPQTPQTPQTPQSGGTTQSQNNLPWIIGGVAGAVVLLVLTNLATAALTRKKYKAKN